jgi:hypothetical protein
MPPGQGDEPSGQAGEERRSSPEDSLRPCAAGPSALMGRAAPPPAWRRPHTGSYSPRGTERPLARASSRASWPRHSSDDRRRPWCAGWLVREGREPAAPASSRSRAAARRRAVEWHRHRRRPWRGTGRGQRPWWERTWITFCAVRRLFPGSRRAGDPNRCQPGTLRPSSGGRTGGIPRIRQRPPPWDACSADGSAGSETVEVSAAGGTHAPGGEHSPREAHRRASLDRRAAGGAAGRDAPRRRAPSGRAPRSPAPGRRLGRRGSAR